MTSTLIKTWLSARLRENSTRVGLVTLGTLLGFSTEATPIVIDAVLGVVGALLVIVPERQPAREQ